MAPKKPNPMEEPPAASSDEEEETEEETSSGEEEEDDDEETPERTQLSSPPSKQPASKKPVFSSSAAAAGAATQAKSSSSEESGSESESDSEPEPTPKPIATRPMEETTPKATKPRSSKQAAKRANETEGTQKDAKRAKKKGADGGEEEEEAASESKKPGEEMKKQLFQRLWSEDDEIAVLKGMIEFSTKKGIDPNQDMNGFHDFIKKSLHVDVSRTQLADKIRRLRKKYKNNLGKGIKKGEEMTFSKPHEQKAYELSKKVWGGEGGTGVVDSTVKSNGKAKKVQNQKGNSKQLVAVKPELVNGPKEVEKMEVDNEKESSLKIVDVEKFLLDRDIGVAGLEDYVIKNGLNMIGASKKAELKQRWRKLQIAQLELYVERSDLVREQAMLMLEALKSSDDK